MSFGVFYITRITGRIAIYGVHVVLTGKKLI